MSAAPASALIRPIARVQRATEGWPIVHLESEVPAWDGLLVDGLVRHPGSLSLDTLAALGTTTHVVDLHCVWGWSKLGVAWRGVHLGAVLDLVGIECGGGDTHVTIASASGTYSSCLRIADAARGILTWARDDAPLEPEQGGPLRYVAPSGYWGYKSVKWASRITVVGAFRPGFWEAKVADPIGCIPDDVQLP